MVSTVVDYVLSPIRMLTGTRTPKRRSVRNRGVNGNEGRNENREETRESNVEGTTLGNRGGRGGVSGD